MKTVLIVEDSADVRESYGRWLVQAGYAVHEAGDGAEAIRLASESVPDVVLLDVGLPGLDGYALAEHWRSDPLMAAVPVIVLSGKDGDEHLRKTRGAGAVIALKKPCPPDMMLAAVKGALRL